LSYELDLPEAGRGVHIAADNGGQSSIIPKIADGQALEELGLLIPVGVGGDIGERCHCALLR